MLQRFFARLFGNREREGARPGAPTSKILNARGAAEIRPRGRAGGCVRRARSACRIHLPRNRARSRPAGCRLPVHAAAVDAEAAAQFEPAHPPRVRRSAGAQRPQARRRQAARPSPRVRRCSRFVPGTPFDPRVAAFAQRAHRTHARRARRAGPGAAARIGASVAPTRLSDRRRCLHRRRRERVPAAGGGLRDPARERKFARAQPTTRSCVCAPSTRTPRSRARPASQDDFQFFSGLGATYFQGPFITRREDWSGNAIGPNTARIAALLARLRLDADTHEIAQLLSQDAALSLRLMRYINSASIGLREEITSIERALLLLGREQLYRIAG